MEAIESFVKDYGARFDFAGMTASTRKSLLSSVKNVLADKQYQGDQVVAALSVIRILSREKSSVPVWMDDEIFNRLMYHSSLSHYLESGEAVVLPDNINTDVVTEATKCLCNLTFNSAQVQEMCARERTALAVLQRAKTYSDVNLNHSVKYFDMRLLFIVTALVRSHRTKATIEWNGLSTLSEVLHNILTQNKQNAFSDDTCDLTGEVLKTLYNLTLVVSPWTEEFSSLEHDITGLIRNLQQTICHKCVTKEKHMELVKHTSNLFTTLPRHLCEYFIPELEEENQPSPHVARSFQGHDLSSLSEILRFLEIVLEESTLATQKDLLLPVLTTLTMLSRSNRVIRKYCRLRILPHLRDEVKRLPEEGDSLRNRLCKLLTTPQTEVKQVVADLLYVLCKENVSRLVKYSGFGNAVGLLAQYGLMRGQSSTSGDYSNDSDSETEEYKELEPNVNPVTGRYETERSDPMDGMTDEQKEYEAVQLLNAMDKLQRLGIVQPSTVGPDGRPVPVDHVLQLAPQNNGLHESDDD